MAASDAVVNSWSRRHRGVRRTLICKELSAAATARRRMTGPVRRLRRAEDQHRSRSPVCSPHHGSPGRGPRRSSRRGPGPSPPGQTLDVEADGSPCTHKDARRLRSRRAKQRRSPSWSVSHRRMSGRRRCRRRRATYRPTILRMWPSCAASRPSCRVFALEATVWGEGLVGRLPTGDRSAWWWRRCFGVGASLRSVHVAAPVLLDPPR